MCVEREEDYAYFVSGFSVTATGRAPDMKDSVAIGRLKTAFGAFLGVAICLGIFEISGSHPPIFLLTTAFAIVFTIVLSGIAKALAKPFLITMYCDGTHFAINKEANVWYCAVATSQDDELICLPLLTFCEQVVEESEEYVIIGKPSEVYGRYVKSVMQETMLIWGVNYVELRIPKTETVVAELEPLLQHSELA